MSENYPQLVCPVCLRSVAGQAGAGTFTCTDCRLSCHNTCPAGFTAAGRQALFVSDSGVVLTEDQVEKPESVRCSRCEQMRLIDEKARFALSQFSELERQAGHQAQTTPSPRHARVNWIYITLLAGVLGVTAVLVVWGWAKKPTVSIEYDVGAIIGGVLAGAGAAAAGIAYAVKTLTRD